MGQVHAPATFRYLLWGSSNINLDITLRPDILKKECKGFNLSHSPGVKLTQCSPFTSYDQMKIYVKINEIHFKVILMLHLNCRWGVTSTLTLRFGTWEILRESIWKKHVSPAGNYIIKVNHGNRRTGCEICLKLTIKTPERRQWCRFGVFIVNFKHTSHLVLLFLLLTLWTWKYKWTLWTYKYKFEVNKRKTWKICKNLIKGKNNDTNENIERDGFWVFIGNSDTWHQFNDLWSTYFAQQI